MACDLLNMAMAQVMISGRGLLGSRFVAPVVFGGGIRVSIDGAKHDFGVVPPDFHGWGVFHPLSPTVALLARDASGAERRQYLSELPAVRLIVRARNGRRTFAAPARDVDGSVGDPGRVEVQLAPDCRPRDTLLARFDGSQFWFDELESCALDLWAGSAKIGGV